MVKKNPSVLDDHSRVKLKAEVNPSKEDYINASTIVRNKKMYYTKDVYIYWIRKYW